MTDRVCDRNGDCEMPDVDGTFVRFPLLPKEIRDMIWSLAIQDMPPRTVVLSIKEGKKKSYVENGERHHDVEHIHALPAPVPTIFHVCFEARARAIFECPWEFGPLLHDGPLFFDFDKDTLIFDSPVTYAAFTQAYSEMNIEGLKRKKGDDQVLDRFFTNIKSVGIKDVLTLRRHAMYKMLWRAKDVAFLNESWRYWPSNPLFNSTAAPRTVGSMRERMSQSLIFEGRLISEWGRQARRSASKRSHEGRLKKPRLPTIEFRDLYEMVPKIGWD